MFSKIMTMKSTGACWEQADKMQDALESADAVIIGAGAGLSTSAGFTYSGERFQKYFSDFIEKYHFQNMYEGGFYPFDSMEEHWAYWSRYIYINRYMNMIKPVYEKLLSLVQDKDYFVLTTNVDHCFQKAGFDKKRLFYTQGDYGLFQCSEPCHDKTYDNKDVVREMVLAQGFQIDSREELIVPEGTEPKMVIPQKLVPRCPICGKTMWMNLRADATFVQDEGWYKAAECYETFLRRHRNMKVLFLELGTGMNTPGIIKYNFWKMVYEWESAVYGCINLNEAYAPEEIQKKSICINKDIGSVLEKL